MAADQLYVAMTRHRKSVKMHIAADRFLEKELEQKAPARSQLSNAGGATSTPSTVLSDLERASVFQRLKQEAMRPVTKLNPSDLLAHRELWLAVDDPVAEFVRQQQSTTPRAQMEDRIASRLLNPGATGIDSAQLSQFSRAEFDRFNQVVIANGEPELTAKDEKELQNLTMAVKIHLRNDLDLWKLNPVARANHERLQQMGVDLLQSVKETILSINVGVAKLRHEASGAVQADNSVRGFAQDLMKIFGVFPQVVMPANLPKQVHVQQDLLGERRQIEASHTVIALPNQQENLATNWPLLQQSIGSSSAAKRSPNTVHELVISRNKVTQSSPKNDLKSAEVLEFSKPSAELETLTVWNWWSTIKRWRAMRSRPAHEQELERQKRLKQRGMER